MSASKDQDYILWLLLNQVRDALFKVRERELLQYGITAMESAVLSAVQALGDKTTPAEIARRIFREHRTVTDLLVRMEKRGLITRMKTISKKNRWEVSLTEKGRNLYQQSSERESIHMAMSSLTKSQRQQLQSNLMILRGQILKQLATEPIIPFP